MTTNHRNKRNSRNIHSHELNNGPTDQPIKSSIDTAQINTLSLGPKNKSNNNENRSVNNISADPIQYIDGGSELRSRTGIIGTASTSSKVSSDGQIDDLVAKDFINAYTNQADKESNNNINNNNKINTNNIHKIDYPETAFLDRMQNAYQNNGVIRTASTDQLTVRTMSPTNTSKTLQVAIPQQYAWVVLGVAFVALFYFICKGVNFIINKYKTWHENKFKNRFVKTVTNTEFVSPTISVVGSKCSNCGCGKTASTRGPLTSHARSAASHNGLSMPKLQKVGSEISRPSSLPYKMDPHGSPRNESKINYMFGNRSTKKCDKPPSHHSGITGHSINIFEQMSNPENFKNLNPSITPNPFFGSPVSNVSGGSHKHRRDGHPATIYGQQGQICSNGQVVDFKNQSPHPYQPHYTKNSPMTPCGHRKCNHSHGLSHGDSQHNLTLGKRSVASVETRNSYIIKKFLLSNKNRHKDSTGCLVGPNGTLKSKISNKDAAAQNKLEALISQSTRSTSSDF